METKKNNGKTLWKNAAHTILKTKTLEKEFDKMDMGSISQVRYYLKTIKKLKKKTFCYQFYF